MSFTHAGFDVECALICSAFVVAFKTMFLNVTFRTPKLRMLPIVAPWPKRKKASATRTFSQPPLTVRQSSPLL